MSDLDKILESDHETGGTQAPQISHSMDPVVNTDLVDTFQLFKTYLDGKMIQLLLTLFRALFSSLTGEISLLGLRMNLPPVGKLCRVSMKVLILRQIQRMKKGYVQRKTGPLGALRIKRDHIRIANMFFQLLWLCLGTVLLWLCLGPVLLWLCLGPVLLWLCLGPVLVWLCLGPVLLLQLQNLHFVESRAGSRISS